MSLRRILSLLCVLLLLSVAAFGETVDLSSLSDDEVVSLLEQVNNEIASRGLQKTALLAKGTYIVGKDLPAGSYIYTCLATGSDWGNVTVYADGGDGDQLLWEVVAAPEESEEPETVFMSLKDGDELKSGVPFSLTISVGILFR